MIDCKEGQRQLDLIVENYDDDCWSDCELKFVWELKASKKSYAHLSLKNKARVGALFQKIAKTTAASQCPEKT
jgi:hypothetical protein